MGGRARRFVGGKGRSVFLFFLNTERLQAAEFHQRCPVVAAPCLPRSLHKALALPLPPM